jgi:lysozyme
MPKEKAMSIAITYKVALEVATHEAIVRQAYKNPGDVWTWSVGLTSATGHKVERYIGKPQSLEHCLRVYVWALDNYADEVREVFQGTTLTEAQFAAALSFHWNTGKIKVASWVKSFKAGNIEQAKKQFMLYRKPASIIERREKERDLFFTGKWAQTGRIGEYTRLHSNGAIDWSSRRSIDVAGPLRAAMAGVIPASDKVIVERAVQVLPPKAKAVVDDAAKTGKTSTTNVATGIGAASGTVAIVKETVDAVKDTTDSTGAILAAGPWVLLLIVALGAGWWIWRERSRKAAAAFAAQKESS